MPTCPLFYMIKNNKCLRTRGLLSPSSNTVCQNDLFSSFMVFLQPSYKLIQVNIIAVIGTFVEAL